MADKIFVDTNVLFRAHYPEMNGHKKALQALRSHRSDELWINRQIIREYLVQVTKPTLVKQPLAVSDIPRRINLLEKSFFVADETRDVTRELGKLLAQFPTLGKQVHDANIVATMLVVGCSTLITFNVADMKRFSSIITLEPLVI